MNVIKVCWSFVYYHPLTLLRFIFQLPTISQDYFRSSYKCHRYLWSNTFFSHRSFVNNSARSIVVFCEKVSAINRSGELHEAKRYRSASYCEYTHNNE